MCKAVLSLLPASQASSVVSEMKFGCRGGQWHSMAISICTTLGLQMSHSGLWAADSQVKL